MLEEKLDALTKEIVALRKAVEENTASGGATAGAADKPKATRGRPKAADVEPEHTKDEVDTIIREVSREVGKPVAQKLIKSFKCADLADLLTHPEHFDAAYTKAEEELAAGKTEEEDEL